MLEFLSLLIIVEQVVGAHLDQDFAAVGREAMDRQVSRDGLTVSILVWLVLPKHSLRVMQILSLIHI